MLPSQAGNLDATLASLSTVSAKLAKVPFKDIGDNLNKLLVTANGTLGGSQMKQTLTALSTTLQNANTTVGASTRPTAAIRISSTNSRRFWIRPTTRCSRSNSWPIISTATRRRFCSAEETRHDPAPAAPALGAAPWRSPAAPAPHPRNITGWPRLPGLPATALRRKSPCAISKSPAISTRPTSPSPAGNYQFSSSANALWAHRSPPCCNPSWCKTSHSACLMPPSSPAAAPSARLRSADRNQPAAVRPRPIRRHPAYRAIRDPRRDRPAQLANPDFFRQCHPSRSHHLRCRRRHVQTLVHRRRPARRPYPERNEATSFCEHSEANQPCHSGQCVRRRHRPKQPPE